MCEQVRQIDVIVAPELYVRWDFRLSLAGVKDLEIIAASTVTFFYGDFQVYQTVVGCYTIDLVKMSRGAFPVQLN